MLSAEGYRPDEVVGEFGGLVSKAYTCGGCGAEFSIGDHVCRGCRGRIVYGALPEEIAKASGAAGAAWASLAFALLFLLPVAVSSCFDAVVPIGLGLGLWGLLLVFAAWICGYRWGQKRAVAVRSGMCRTVLSRGRS